MNKALKFSSIILLSSIACSVMAESPINMPTAGHEDIVLPPRDYGLRHKRTPSLPWWSASNQEVLRSPCRVELNTRELTQKVKRMSEQNLSESITIRGVEFRYGSHEVLNAFRDLVTRYDFSGRELDESEQIDIQKNHQINPNCYDAFCASQILFGRSVGPLVLYMKYRYGMNASHLVHRNATRPNMNEIKSFIRSLSDFPEHLFPLQNNRQMVRFKRGATLAIYRDGRTLANASMSFFDGWEELGLNGEVGRKDYVATHEVGHVLGSEFGLDSHDEWLKLSEWNQVDKRWHHGGEQFFISGYSKTNPSEDFAETVSAYRYNARMLKQLVPEKYNFMRDYVFGGVEYLNQTACDVNSSDLYRYLSRVFNLSQDLRTPDLVDLTDKSGPYIAQDLSVYLTGGMTKSQFINALEGAIAQVIFIDENPNFSELQKIIQGRHLALILKNTDKRLFEEADIHLAKKRLLRRIRDYFVEALNERDYMFRVRNLENRSEIKEACAQYSEYGIIYNDLDEYVGGFRFAHRMRRETSKIREDYCLDTTRRIGTSSRPRKVDALLYANRFFAPFLNVQEEFDRAMNLILEADQLRESSDSSINLLRRLSRNLEIRDLESQAQAILEKL